MTIFRPSSRRGAALAPIAPVSPLPEWVTGEIGALVGWHADVLDELDEIAVAVARIDAAVSDPAAVREQLARIRRCIEIARGSSTGGIAGVERLAEQVGAQESA